MPKATAETLAIRARPEAELLLCCARTRMNGQSAQRIQALIQQEIDWDYLLRVALYHGIMPLLYWHLKNISPASVPRTTWDHLQDQFRVNLLNNLLLTDELINLLKLFETHGIPAVPYKGPTLAASVYGNVALRPSGDLDILVHKRDIPRARDLVLAQGYRQQFHSAKGAAEYAYSFVQHERPLVVELHWRIAPSFYSFAFDLRQVREFQPVSLAGMSVPSLMPEDLLLVLCVHGAKHKWERLTWICDIAQLLRAHPKMDWPRCRVQARRLGSERMLLLGLLLASNLLRAPLPEPVRQWVEASAVVKALAGQVYERLFREADAVSEGAPAKFVRNFRIKLWMRERLRDRTRLALHDVFKAMRPTRYDRALLTLPRSLSFFFYLIRPLRLTAKYALRPLKRRQRVRKLKG